MFCCCCLQVGDWVYLPRYIHLHVVSNPLLRTSFSLKGALFGLGWNTPLAWVHMYACAWWVRHFANIITEDKIVNLDRISGIYIISYHMIPMWTGSITHRGHQSSWRQTVPLNSGKQTAALAWTALCLLQMKIHSLGSRKLLKSLLTPWAQFDYLKRSF